MNPYDAIIVGSGAGGAAAAHRLVAAGWRVLMLEKGSALPVDGSTLDVKRVVGNGEFLSREPWVDGSGREFAPEEHFNVGGKTKWYGAAVLRFGQHEFEADLTHQCRAWPIGYRDLAPYYAQAEQLLGVREFACEPDLARISARVTGKASGWYSKPLPMALSADILRDRHEAAHFDGFATARDLKADAENVLIRPLAISPNFKLMTNADVETLLPAAGSPRRIDGVRLADGREFRARHVLLAAGALHSPRILETFLRTHVTPGPLANNVGRNLKLHLLTALVAVSPGRKTDLIRKTTLLLNEAYPHSSVQALGFDAELIGNLIPRAVPRFIAHRVADRAYGFFLQTEDGSSPENRVVGAMNGGKPLMNYDDSRVATARSEHRKFVFGFQRALAGAGMLSLTKRIGLAGTAHVCGTLVAGNDPADSAVDANGRAHELEGLYVVDGSVLPRSSRVNPSLTIFAWALRTADLLARNQAVERSSVIRSIDSPIGEPA